MNGSPNWSGYSEVGELKWVQDWADVPRPVGIPQGIFEEKRNEMANTKAVTDKAERKELKRAARKKAAPKGPRVGARGENKQKVKKAARGQSKRK